MIGVADGQSRDEVLIDRVVVGDGSLGVNRVDDPSLKSGYRLVGDVHFEQAKQVAAAITPVPGGVGPMTITMLLYNTVQAARQWADR